MGLRRLIVTADDFGADSFVNRAVVRAFKEGLLRHASLLVDAPAAKEAAALAKENPGLGVGIHLDLCPEIPPGPALWGLRYFFSPYWRGRLIPEIRRQLDKFVSYGLKPQHADGHLNIHVHPVIFPALAALGRDYGISRIRLPAGESSLCAAFEGRRFPKNFSDAAIFRALEFYLRDKTPPGVLIPDRCFGLLRSGLMSEDYLLWLLERLPEGTAEIYFHPSLDPASRVLEKPTASHQTITELEALTSPRVREAVERLGIDLI